MKLVREKLNEKFAEDSDPIEDLGIGTPELVKFKKMISEIENFPNQDLSKMNFRDNAQKIHELREISGTLAIIYFSEKYGLNFKHSELSGSMLIGYADLENWKFFLEWSTNKQSIALFIQHPERDKWRQSGNCQSMKSLEANFKRFCKELNIPLPK